jgi:NAD(P)-dependent dehydrogenase (short-subunit alcohol dehydrogenase family)
MQIDLSGRTAFVSGSTQGIGLAIAHALAACGARTTINGRDEARVRAVVDEHPDAGFEGVAADVATADGAQRLFAALADVDILVNNLGIFAPAPLLEIDDTTWQRFWEVNVLSGIRLTRHYVRGATGRPH